MKKLILFFTPLLLVTIAFFAYIFFFQKDLGKGALQVTSAPKSAVYLNGRFIGNTPLSKSDPKDMITVGDYSIRLVPEDKTLATFEEKIKISSSVLTVVDRVFDKGAGSEASILTLNKISNSKAIELLIISFPDNSKVDIDSNISKNTPTLIKDLTESDHEIKISKDGYKEKIIHIRTISGYKLIATVYLGISPTLETLSPTLTIQASDTTKTSSNSGSIAKVSILKTSVGFLRVRQESSTSSAEIAKVYPKETYDLIDEESDWYQIKLKDGSKGWISKQFANKINP